MPILQLSAPSRNFTQSLTRQIRFQSTERKCNIFLEPVSRKKVYLNGLDILGDNYLESMLAELGGLKISEF
jgi:hypothetical protein